MFFGLSLATPRAALVRAILEGTAFALRHNVEMAIRAGAEVREMRSVGGCSRSDLVEPDQGGRSGDSSAAATHIGRLSVRGCHCGGSGSWRLS